MSTESAQRDKLKRLKEERLKNTLPLQSFSTQSARKNCPGGPPPELKSKPNFLTDKKKTILESQNEVISSSSQSVINSKPPSPIAVQPTLASFVSIQEQKQLRNRKRRERMKKKREEKKRELLDAVNSSSIDEIGEKCVDDNQSEDRPVDDEEIKEEAEIEPVLEMKEKEGIKLDKKPSQCQSELDRKLWKNIAEDLEDLEDVSSDSLDCNDQGLTMEEEIKLSKEEEALTVQSMIMDLEEEEPSDWEDREPPLEGELVDCDDPDITIRVHDSTKDSTGEGQDEQCVVLLSSDDESIAKQKSKKSLSKEIDRDILKIKNGSSLELNENAEEDAANNKLALSEDSDNAQLEASKNGNENNPPELESPIHLRIEAVTTQKKDSDLKNPEGDNEWVEEDWVETEEYQDEANMEVEDENEFPQETIKDGDAISQDEEREDESEKINIDGEDLEEGQTYDDTLEEDQAHDEDLEEEGHADGEDLEEEGNAVGDDLEEAYEDGDHLEEGQVDGDALVEGQEDDELEEEHADGDEVVEDQSNGDELNEEQAAGEELDEEQERINELDEEKVDGDPLVEGQVDGEELEDGQKDGDDLDKVQKNSDELDEGQTDGVELGQTKNDDELDGVEKEQVEKTCEKNIQKLDKPEKNGDEVISNKKNGEKLEIVAKDCDKSGPNDQNSIALKKAGENVLKLKESESNGKLVKEGDEETNQSEENMEVDELVKDDDKLVTTIIKMNRTVLTSNLPEKKEKEDSNVNREEKKIDTTVNDSTKEGEKLKKEEKSTSIEGETEWMENVEWVENDAWTEDQDEELEDGEIKIIGKGQQPSKNNPIADAEEEKKMPELDGEKSPDGSSVPSPAASSLAETEDSQLEISSDKGKKVEIESAEAKFDFLFKSTPNKAEVSKTNDTKLSETDKVLKISKNATSILSKTENILNEDRVPDLSIEGEVGGGKLTIDEAPTLIREDIETPKLNSANDEEVEMETNRISSKSSEVVMREGSVSEGTDDARLQLDFSSEDETPVGSSAPSTSILAKEVKISQTKAENNINGNECISQVKGDDEAQVETKDEVKDESLSRKRVNEEVNVEVFVSERVPKKAKLDDEDAVKDEKKNFEDQVTADPADPMEDNDEYKDLRIASSPRKLTMHDLESIIRAKIFDYVEECNKAKMDALGERVEELEKQVERWKKRASYLESQVKEAESEIELYKVQVATNKQNEKATAAAAAAAVTTSPHKPTLTLSKPSTTTTANTFSRKSTTTPSSNLASTITSIAPNRNLGPPPSSGQQSNAKKVDITPTPTPTKPTTAVPLQLIANTALSNSPPKPKPMITPTKQPPTGVKSTTIIDLTEEEEDKSATKVASSPNRQVVFKPTPNPNAPKNNPLQAGRSLLQSSSTPVSVSLPSGQLVTLPVMPGTSLPSMVQLIPQGSATIASTIGSGVRLSGPNSNIRSSTFTNQAGAQLAYLINQSGVPNRNQLFTAPGGILQNTARPGQMPTFLVMRNPIPTSAGRMTGVGTMTGGSTSINTIPLGGSGLSISMTRPQVSVQSPGTSKQRHPIPTINLAMPTGNAVNQRPKPIVPLKHPAPLPPQPQYQPSPTMKVLPPRPALKISKVSNGIVLSWNMTVSPTHAEIVSYQLYAYQETNVPSTTSLWKKVGDVKALPLPMACTLTQFIEGNRYYFAVRAVDVHTRIGPFSDPTHIILPSKPQTVQKM